MILSEQQIFSDKQAVTATAVSTNVIDLGVAGVPYGAAAALNHDVGKGAKVPVLAQVTTAFGTAAGMTALTIAIETGATAALGTVVLSQTILLADLVAGKQVSFDVLPNDLNKRYLGFRYTPVTGNANAGNITAAITMGNQTNVTGA